MANIRVLIVEDEELYADKMEMLLDKLGYEHLATVDNSGDALEAISNAMPDFVIMDIHIAGNHDGIETAELIHEINPNIAVLFATSLQDDLTFKRATRTNPVGFITKPFDALQLQRSMEMVVMRLEKDAQESDSESQEGIFATSHFFVKNRRKLEKVNFDEIVFLESDGRHCTVHSDLGRYVLRISMSELIEKLPKKQFVQTHRSFFVNLTKVKNVDLELNVVHSESHEIPLSKRNKDEFLARLNVL